MQTFVKSTQGGMGASKRKDHLDGERDVIRHTFDIAIVGGGFSGLMIALNCARSAPGATIAILERTGEAGRGVAYARHPSDAVLNVPAEAMGAFADAPEDFERWLRSVDSEVDPHAFIARNRYGDYLQSLLARAQQGGAQLTVIRAEIADAVPIAEGRSLIDTTGAEVARSVEVVLALGVPPPADPLPKMDQRVRRHPAYVADPWRDAQARRTPTSGAIAVIGSGLTALDVIAGIARGNGTNHVHVISRRGRFPLEHAAAGPAYPPFASDPPPVALRALVADVRRAVRAAAAEGRPWQAVMDGLRAQVAGLWQQLSVADRRRYLRHLRPFFEIHRHRAPPALLATVEALKSDGRLTLHAGRIERIEPDDAGLKLTLRERSGQRIAISCGQLINCSGPASDYTSANQPLLERLLSRGEIAVDPIGMGLQADITGRLIDARGRVSGLSTIGWPLRGLLLETTSVRELREQAARLGVALAARLRRP